MSTNFNWKSSEQPLDRSNNDMRSLIDIVATLDAWLEACPPQSAPFARSCSSAWKRRAEVRRPLRSEATPDTAELIESVGANGFSLRRLANALGVGPTTIHFHFEGGVGPSFARSPSRRWPASPGRTSRRRSPPPTLRELLVRILEALQARPVVAKLVVLAVVEPRAGSPARRAGALGSGRARRADGGRPKMFQRAMGVIFEMILAECGRSSAEDQKEASAQMHNTIATLSSTEFPNLTELREAIVAETVQAGAAKPSPEVTAGYADRLIATLGVK